MIIEPLELPKLYPKQREAIYDARRYSVIEASTKAGKTIGCIHWLLSKAWNEGNPHRNYWWVAPVATQADIAFGRVRKNLDIEPAPVVHLVDQTIQLPNGATLWFKSADRPDSLYGEDVYAAVIDEASRVKADAWYAIRSTLTATRGPVRIIGNVKGRKNWFYMLARQGEAGDPDVGYHRLTALDAVEAGVFPKEEYEDARKRLPDHVFRELYMADPGDDGGNPFGLEAIAGCVGQLSTAEPVCWGWDLAKSVDWTVGVALDRERRVCRLERWRSPWGETKARILALTGGTAALVDSTGVGDPILEELQRSGVGWYEGFKFGSTNKQQLVEGLASLIQQRKVTFPDGPIRLELESYEFIIDEKTFGVRYSAPSGQHDDCVMALALACFKYKKLGIHPWGDQQMGLPMGASQLDLARAGMLARGAHISRI